MRLQKAFLFALYLEILHLEILWLISTKCLIYVVWVVRNLYFFIKKPYHKRIKYIFITKPTWSTFENVDNFGFKSRSNLQLQQCIAKSRLFIISIIEPLNVLLYFMQIVSGSFCGYAKYFLWILFYT